jgi:hypothetical protein
MKTIPDNSFDAVVTDPPAGIGFMGKSWDTFKDGPPPSPFVRLAGGKDRGTGPKGRQGFIDFLTPRLAEARRLAKPGAYLLCWALPRTSHWTGLAIEDAGWVIRDRVSHLFGSGFPKSKSVLKPACEDWWLAWKPAAKVTPLNVKDCRIPSEGGRLRDGEPSQERRYTGNGGTNFAAMPGPRGGDPSGRWPANVTHDGSDEVMEAFAAFGLAGGGFGVRGSDAGNIMYGSGKGLNRPFTGQTVGFGDTGTAARFFYCAKSPKSDRGQGNTHPTVKNTELMRWLCRLITPKQGDILDLFMGSGSTGLSALMEGFGFFGIESDPESFGMAERRFAEFRAKTPLFKF